MLKILKAKVETPLWLLFCGFYCAVFSIVTFLNFIINIVKTI